MELTLYQVDAFTTSLFGGNPAAIIPLNKWLPDELMQAIALENNLSETCFIVPDSHADFHIRWFTPTKEVNLCGHATLATAHVLFRHLGFAKDEIKFSSASGLLTVKNKLENISMDFPATPVNTLELSETLKDISSSLPQEVYTAGEDLLFIYGTQSEIENLHINEPKLKCLPYRGLICSAPGNDVDFVSRFFAPAFGISEDPVTGSAHTALAPYWSKKLHKETLIAEQLSARKGRLNCTIAPERVHIAGQAVTYMIGKIFID